MQFSNNDTESSDSEEEDDHKDKDSSLVNATTLSQTFTNLTEHKKNNYRIKIPPLNAKASINGKEFNIIKNSKNNLILFKNKDRPKHNPSIGTTDNITHTKDDNSIQLISSGRSIRSNYTIKIPLKNDTVQNSILNNNENETEMQLDMFTNNTYTQKDRMFFLDSSPSNSSK